MKASEYPVSNIPESLKQHDQWVAWKEIARDGHPTKVPIDVHSGQFASVSDSTTWASFDEAMEYFGQDTELKGLGFVFTADDPFAGVDLDDCLDKSGEFVWGKNVVTGLGSYTEVSPSGRGVKVFLRGKKPTFARCRKDGLGPAAEGKLEVYDCNRFFAVTGKRLPDHPDHILSKQEDLEGMCRWLWPTLEPDPDVDATAISRSGEFDACLQALRRMNLTDHKDGSHRLFVACCRCIEHGLSDVESLRCIRQYTQAHPFPRIWADREILRRLRDAEGQCDRGSAKRETPSASIEPDITPQCVPVGKLVERHPVLREPIIEGLLRRGETMNVIAPPKLGKSWLVLDLAMAVATGSNWLDTYPTHQGNVLLLDNELHAETSANRIPRVASARDIPAESLNDSMFIDNLRGRLPDINALGSYFDGFKPGFFRMIVLDAFYRFMPKDTDENSNGNVTDLYNVLDRYAAKLQCSFVLVHHASKGNQSVKSVTDVGAGAGSQSRATDTHLVLRHHQEPGCVVVDAAVRSWPPIEPKVLRWSFPVWYTDDSLEAKDLKMEYTGRRRAESKAEKEKAPKEQWTAEMFSERFVSEEPQRMTTIRSRAGDVIGSRRKAKELQQEAEDLGLIHQWKEGANRPVKLASIKQPATFDSDDF